MFVEGSNTLARTPNRHRYQVFVVGMLAIGLKPSQFLKHIQDPVAMRVPFPKFSHKSLFLFIY